LMTARSSWPDILSTWMVSTDRAVGSFADPVKGNDITKIKIPTVIFICSMTPYSA
jgi:hypothetical protein